MKEPQKDHVYTLPHGGSVTTAARAAAAVFLVLMANGAKLPIIVGASRREGDNYVVTLSYKGDRI